VLKFIGAPNEDIDPTPKALNSSASLAQTPTWALRVSQHSEFLGIRAVIPSSVRSSVRRALAVMARQQARKVPDISHEARQRIADAVAEDASRFRALTGRAFAHWSV
jgi:hypothetical protein